jgi:hypothetical protein
VNKNSILQTSSMLLALTLATGCVTERVVVKERVPVQRQTVIVEEVDPTIVVREAPPPVVQEVVTVAPGSNHIWIAGYYGYRGGRYVWTSGRWMLPPGGHTTWVPGHWANGPDGWRWRPGQWR